MLSESRVRVGMGRPRWWSLAACSALLASALLVAGNATRAWAATYADDEKQTKKDDPEKKEQPKTPPSASKQREAPAPQAGFNPQQIQERMRRQMMPGGFSFQMHQPRLGIMVGRPSETLVEQLGLPKDHALVVENVLPNTPAAKAGIKPHDILLEVEGKPVPSEPHELSKMIHDIKTDTAIDAVVLRKGKKETIKDIKLPEFKAAAPLPGLPGFQGQFAPPPGFAPGAPGAPQFQPQAFPGLPQGGFQGRGRNFVMTSTWRNDDNFTTTHRQGALSITVTGKMAEGKAKVSQIQIQDGAEHHAYDSLDKVPENHRDQVSSLVEMTEKGNIKAEVKTHEEKKKPEENKKEEPRPEKK